MSYTTPTLRYAVPRTLLRYLRYGRRRRMLATLQNLGKLLALVLCGLSIPFLAWAGIWLAFAIFGA